MHSVRTLLAACSLLAACGHDLSEPLQSGQVMRLYGLEGRWVGQVVPTEPGCGATTQGLMTIGSSGFAFDPFQSTSVIKGEVADNHLDGTLVRQGPEHKDLSLVFTAVAESSRSIGGTLQSGRCRWTVTLGRG